MDSDSVFYDFGCGNGSVLFQTAFMTGAKCVGFEINPINVKVAKEVWKVLRPKLEKIGGRSLDVTIECVDFCQYLKKNESFFQSPCVIWAANLLLPRPVNHYLSEQFRRCAVGTQILCFEDFYPHGRSLARLRDPEAFELFEMRDYVWPPLSVEWCTLEGTRFIGTNESEKERTGRHQR
ncbi:histone-lysine N-methyltransferase [Angomonas deanei]|uniref:Histone-lysine N-methyltransferase, H3 lysine-79 specific n=1 Tax=Angomonas deanei TaxID=59799 RepID=A0A7G2C8F7_9TRYP|nr:histone-lysine N-methyltransferase [Angomonas deanei]CAD2215321.1 Histone methylation protein DOT1, putative [Angomonas deanei]|eukprot:EPY35404.1 histone-lysine N-methyltransferase [Angomonas deanei]